MSTPEKRKGGKPNGTLCWDCSHATETTGVCPWASSFQPVSGWKAKRRIKRKYESYFVEECPLFDRDSVNSGQKRINQ